MAIKSFVKTGGAWKQPTKMWTKVNGTWRQITKGFVKVSGAWKQVYQLGDMLYNYGTEVVAWTTGYSDGRADIIQEKLSDQLHTYATDTYKTSSGTRTWVTSAKFDVTNYSKIVLEGYAAGPYDAGYGNATDIQLAIAASNTTYKDADMAAKVSDGTLDYSKNVRLELDVSTFTGTYYINIQTCGLLATYQSPYYYNGYNAKIYQVYAVK